MRLIPTHRAPDRSLLGRDVESGDPEAAPLLRAGLSIDERQRELLLRAGIRAIWIDDELSRGVEPMPLLSPDTRREASLAVGAALDEARESLNAHTGLSTEAVAALSRATIRIRDDVLACPDTARALLDLSADHEFPHGDAAGVAALGMLIAKRLLERHGWVDFRGERRIDRREQRLAYLGIGLLMHDIGKLAIPDRVLQKRGDLTEEEWALMRRHPEDGVALLSQSVSPLVADVVRSHHERWDGSGYPRGRAADDISQLARIAAVADVYDAVTTERPYAPARPPHEAVRLVREGAGTQFDPEVVAAFCHVVLPFPPGQEIEAPDGRIGVVVDADPERPEAPLVRLPLADGEGFEEVRLTFPEFELPAEAPPSHRWALAS